MAPPGTGPLAAADAVALSREANDIAVEAVRRHPTRLRVLSTLPMFKRYGVPKAIQCDNGVPFVAVQARAGLSGLSAWWVSLGIRLLRSRPGCPQDNGGHERMHSDVRADVQARPATTREEQQRVIDRWRQEFNHVRPHQALDGKTPADVYKVVDRRRPVPKSYAYPKHFYVGRVGAGGLLYFRGDKCPVGAPFKGLHIGVEVIDALRLRLWLHDVDLGVIETLPAVDDACFEQPTLGRPRRSKTHPAPPRSRAAPASSSESPSLPCP
jgi:putative transposase